MNNLFQFLKSGKVRRSISRRIKESKYLRYLRLAQPETRIWFREKGELPDFLIIGAQRSGSTFLHDTLTARTSARCSPLQKEVHYFDNKFYKPLDWYAKFFQRVDGNCESVKTFEASPGYLYHPGVPKRVKHTLSSVKLIAVLRDPVERALSQYRWIRQVGLETRGAVESFRYDAERLDRERDPDYLKQFDDPLHFDFDHFHRGYLRRSLYDVQLRRWLEHFDASQIRVVGSSFLFDQTEEVLSELTEFLGVELLSSEASAKTVNQNSSHSSVSVPAEARQIAERHLSEIPENMEAVVTDQMIIGERPLFE
jgi:LPS sulfotransferase NodH